MKKFYYSNQYKEQNTEESRSAIDLDLIKNLNGSANFMNVCNMLSLDHLFNVRSTMSRQIIDNHSIISEENLEICYQQLDYVNDQIRQILFL